MKKFDNITFIRFGSLNQQKHKESRNSEKSFHTAPKFKGIYAFPQGLVEKFLLGGNYGFGDRVFYLKDKDGNKICDHDIWDFDSYDETTGRFKIKPQYKQLIKSKRIKTRDLTSKYIESEEQIYTTYWTNKHTFKYTGDIWHHLGCELPKSAIIDEVNSWYKTTYKDYVIALKRSFYKEKFSSYLNDNDRHGNPASYKHTFTKDHYEVFIEKLK